MTFRRIGLVVATSAGERHAAVLRRAWPDRTGVAPGDGVGARLARAWRECDAVIAFLATGALVRLLAPVLSDKRSDPPVVAVDEAARFAVALTGAHHGGNDLAHEVAELLGACPVVTTATDAVGLPGLDTLGWPVEGAVAAVSRALLDGRPVRWEAEEVWPLPALPANVSADADADADADAGDRKPDPDDGDGAGGGRAVAVLRVSDLAGVPGGATAVLRPPSLVLGVGASRGVAAGEVEELVDSVLARHGLSPASVRAMSTAGIKASEAGVVEAARRRGLPLLTWSSEELAAVEVPNPSEVVRAAVGTPSVAEAAALLGDRRGAGVRVSAGPAARAGAELVAPKTASGMATVAVARHRPRGRLAVVGLGPGARDLLPARARAEIRRASVVVGLDQYVDQVRDLLRPGTVVLASGLGEEEARARGAVEQARLGRAVALLGSGDAGIYAMASPALDHAGDDVEVVGVPGITAGLAAAAALGAPLGHDHVYVSLSDLHTPWQVIERRVRAAAEGDFVVLFYNPRSRARDWQLGRALDLLREHRRPATPVGVVRNATRPDEAVLLGVLGSFDPAVADMYSVVVVGSTQTRVVAGRIVTPRGYRWQP